MHNQRKEIHMAQANTAPSTTPPSIDTEAESAIRDAIKALVQSGKRAYSLSVPLAAEKLLVARGEGKITSADASARIGPAIAAMAERGVLEAHAEGRFDWKLLD
jgi:hypothetical protein